MSRILIVDDDGDLVTILSRALESSGYEVHTASDPAAAMKKARETKPDLAILDYHMPQTTGAHLFETLRRNKSTASLPIIFMSGEASNEQIHAEIAEDSSTRFIAKPASIAQLRRLIQELLAVSK